MQVSENLKLKQLKRGQINTTKEVIIQKTNAKWQEEWDNATVGRFTHDLLPLVNRGDHVTVEADHLSMQLLSNHGASMQYLNRFGRLDSPACDWCFNVEESLYHAICICPKYQLTQERLSLIQSKDDAGLIWPPNLKDILGKPEVLLKAKSLLAKVCLENSGLTAHG